MCIFIDISISNVFFSEEVWCQNGTEMTYCSFEMNNAMQIHKHTPKLTQLVNHLCSSYLVDKAQREPTATAYVAPSQPTYLKATGRGLFLSSM